MKRIIFLVPHPPGISPSQRFRFEEYFDLLTQNGFAYRVQGFLSASEQNVFNSPGAQFRKATALLKGFFRRLTVLITVSSYDFVFVHRECAPMGPPIFEWLIAKIFRKKIIYDFDDAIWMTDKTDESTFVRWLKWRKKVATVCRWSYKVSCGNDYLCAYARQFNSNVVYNPTTLDTDARHNPELYARSVSDVLTIGWTGSYSTLKYLLALDDVLQELQTIYGNLRIMVIADQSPALNAKFEFRRWSEQTEVPDLMEFDIGIMPLPDDEWSKGKCGFKALQYLALEIPAIASPVGVNTKIIANGEVGFLCATPMEWLSAMKMLIADRQLRKEMGKKGRTFVEQNYSVNSNYVNFLSLFS